MTARVFRYNQDLMSLISNTSTYERYWEDRTWLFQHDYKNIGITLYKLTAAYIDYKNNTP